MTTTNNFTPAAKSHFLHAMWGLRGAFLTHHISSNLAQCVCALWKTNLDNEFLERKNLWMFLVGKKKFQKELTSKYGR